MKNLLFTILFITISCMLLAQDSTQAHYKRQIGFDIKPAINSFSGVSTFPLLAEYEILYTKALSPKITLMTKLAYIPYEYQFIEYKSFISVDSTLITNSLTSLSNARLHFNLSRKITKKRINLYWGITTGMNFNQGIVLTNEYDTVGTLFQQNALISQTTKKNNFMQLVFGPSFGLELPINERWHILANFNLTGRVAFGNWEYVSQEKEIVSETPYFNWDLDIKLLQDIGIMYSF